MSAAPSPFAFTTSLAWDGNDGQWSTFIIRVGTPPQSFRVIPSTLSNQIVIPLVDGCLPTDPTNCGALRGAYAFNDHDSSGFLVNSSSTWNNNGLYEVILDRFLGYQNNALYGYDNVGLQVENSGGLDLKNQTVAGIATKDFYLGLFGLAPEPTNFSSFADPKPSFMTTLKDQKKIPSLSYGYTAGAKYVRTGVLASLTLGGYDQSRFNPDNQNSFDFASQDTKLLTVGVQAITAINTLSGVVSLLPNAVFSVLDSTLPYIWLPKSSCDVFETALGLTYDPKTKLYLVNDTVHTKLQNLKPTFTFKLGADLVGGKSTNIQLPYAAFDLQAGYPFYNDSTNYFPIKRAANDTQYVIGRSFFQEAYLVADYERRNFSIFQAIQPNGDKQNIIPITSTDPSGVPSGVTEMPQSSKLQTGAIAGIVVGAVVVIAALLALLWWLRKRRQRRQQQGQAVAEPRTSSPRGHELDSWYKLRDHKPSEADSRQLLSEEYNVKYKHELPGRYEHELPGKEQQDRQEMDTGPVSPELEGDGQAYELAGDTIHPFHRDSRNSPGISPSSSTRKYQSLNSPP